MKTKVLHLVGGSLTDGAYKGANILHEALLELNVDSKILNFWEKVSFKLSKSEKPL